jgi:hypothetical protein
MSLVLQFNDAKLYRIFVISLILVCALLLSPTVKTIADELGGYASEPLINRSGTNNSELVIGGQANSLLDIISDGTNHFHENTAAFQINALIPLVLMAMLIIMLLGVLARGEMNIVALITVVVLIYMFYSIFPSIQEMVNQLLIGG